MRHAILTLAFVLTGCGLDLSAPASIDLPLPRLDVDAERAALEAQVCADATSDACLVLMALDRTDGTETVPPSLPAEIPAHVTVTTSGGTADIDVAAWIADQEQAHALLPAHMVPLGAGQLGGAASALSAARIDDVAFVFSNNELNMDVPPFEVWVGHSTDGDTAEALVASGNLVRIARAAAQPAYTDGRADLSLVAGGADVLANAVTAGDAVLVVGLADGSLPALAAGAAPNTLARPGGTADITLSLAVTVELTQLATGVHTGK